MSVFNTETRNVTKEFKLNTIVSGIKMIDCGKSVLIAEENCDLTNINLKTMEMSSSHKNVTNGKVILTIILFFAKEFNLKLKV